MKQTDGDNMTSESMTFQKFREIHGITMEDLCRKIFSENRESIKIKKEETAVRNLMTIFSATLDLAVEKGFNAMTLRDLSQKSELSMGCLYSYFSSKEELLDLIQTQGRIAGMKILSAAVEETLEPAQKLRTAVRSHLFLSEVMQKWFYFSYMETKNLSKAQHKKSIENELFTEQIFADILEEGLKAGVFKISDTLLTAAVIKSMLQDWYLKRWKYKKRGIGVEAYADFVISFVESAIRP